MMTGDILVIQSIILAASLLTSLAVIIGGVYTAFKWFAKQEKQDEDIASIKEEQSITCRGILACLDGLQQLGCNHTVPKVHAEIEEYINKKAHK